MGLPKALKAEVYNPIGTKDEGELGYRNSSRHTSSMTREKGVHLRTKKKRINIETGLRTRNTKERDATIAFDIHMNKYLLYSASF